LRKLQKLFTVCATAIPLIAHAGNYPLGTLTCDDMGLYAKELVIASEAKKSKETALQELQARKFNDPVEQKALTDVLNLVYSDFGQQLSADVAYGAIKYDCEKGRPEAKEQ
jgi:hypothetical protein